MDLVSFADDLLTAGSHDEQRLGASIVLARGRGARRVRPQERHPAAAHCTYARKLLMDWQCCDHDT
jgi:hypothetical protein